MSAPRAQVFAAFRRLNRARMTLFKGDDHAMTVSRQQMMTEFNRNKAMEVSTPIWEAHVAGIDEAADMLKHEIVRGNLNEDTGRYEVKIERKHVEGSATGETKPEIEPITEETYERMANPDAVEVTKSCQSK